MFERFTDRARKVMQLANQESLRLNNEYLGTEHLLFGLTKEGAGVAAAILGNLGVAIGTVRVEIEKFMPPREGDMVTMGKLPLTPRVKSVIEFACGEATMLGHRYIGTEHLLLGLLREEKAVGHQILLNLGLTADRVREELLRLLKSGKKEAVTPAKELWSLRDHFAGIFLAADLRKAGYVSPPTMRERAAEAVKAADVLIEELVNESPRETTKG